MIIYLSLFVAIVGLIVYFAATNPKLVELGRLAFFAGLLAFLLTFKPEMLSLIHG